MAELIVGNGNGSLDFGDYTLETKTKKEDFPFDGASYKVKTFKEITKLERNGLFVYESVPGSKVTGLVANENGISFSVESNEDLSITLGLDENATYSVSINGKDSGNVETKLGGKLNVSVEMDGTPVEIKVVKA